MEIFGILWQEVIMRPMIVKIAPKKNIDSGSIDSITASFLRFGNGILSILFWDKIPVKPKGHVGYRIGNIMGIMWPLSIS